MAQYLCSKAEKKTDCEHVIYIKGLFVCKLKGICPLQVPKKDRKK